MTLIKLVQNIDTSNQMPLYEVITSWMVEVSLIGLGLQCIKEFLVFKLGRRVS